MKTHLLRIVLACLLIPVGPAVAQSSDFDRAFASKGAEARVTLTIPFGGNHKTLKSKPQLTLVGRQYQSDMSSMNWAMKNGGRSQGFTESRLAITLSRQPNLLLNDQILMQFYQEQAGLSDDVKTAGKVALGAGLIVVAVGVVSLGVLIISYEADDT